MSMAGFTVEILATGTNPNQAVKVMILKDEDPGNTHMASWRASCSAQFRIHYGEWPKNVKSKVTPR